MLVAVIFMLTILIISMSVAAPKVAREIQRDRERENMQRGKQYARAIQLYYKKFHAYPPNMDALVKTSEIRFLRRKYVDLTTGKAEWKPIRYGQAKTQTLGFFGKPIPGAGSAGGTMMAGIGPSGGNGLSGGSSFGSSGSSFGSSSSSGSSSIFGTSSVGTGVAAPTSTGSGSTDSSGGTSSADTNSGSTTGTGLSGETSGQTFGGAGIIGVSPMSPKQSILVWRKKNHYNEWEFIYDPLSEMRTVSGNIGGIGQPASSTTTPVGGSSSSGSSFGGSSFGGSGSGSTTVQPPQF